MECAANFGFSNASVKEISITKMSKSIINVKTVEKLPVKPTIIAFQVSNIQMGDYFTTCSGMLSNFESFTVSYFLSVVFPSNIR